MLLLVIDAVVVLDVAESLLLKVKVLLDVVLRLLGNCENISKQHIVFLVEPAVVNLE